MEKLGTIPLSKDILSKSAIGLWAFELDEGRPPRMYVDETMAGLLGMKEPLTPEQTYHAWYDHVDALHYGLVAAAVEKMVAGRHAEVQYPWHHPDGRTVYVRCGGVRNDAYGPGVRIEGCHRDVTELMHFQREMQRHVVDALGAGYVAILQLDFATCSAQALRCPAVYVDRVGGETCSFSDYTRCFRAYVEQEIASGYRAQLLDLADPAALRMFLADTARRELLVCKKSGAWVRFTFCALGGLEATDASVIVGATVLDAESSQRAAMEKEREETLDMLGAATWRMAMTRDGQVSEFVCSENARALLGFSEREFPAISAADFRARIHGEDIANVRDTLNRVVGDPAKTGFECECRFRCHDGEYRWFRVYARCEHDAERGVVYMHGVVTDVHALHEKVLLTERLSRALDEAKTAERMKTTFLATMSHEIRTPLNAVIGFADFLQDPDLPADERLKYLSGITRSSNALLSLINDILDLSKIDAGKVVVRGGVCHVGKLLDEMKSIFHFNAIRKGVVIGSEIADDFPAVALKEERIRQILLNLVGNAVKFTDHGQVFCSATWRPGAPGRGTMVIQVRDTGVGIPKAKQSEIFDPFVQGDGVRGEKVYQGTGLGLPICRRLVEAVGGTITLQSEEGKGATFTVEIPDVEVSDSRALVVEAVADPQLSDIVVESPRKIQVIAVDDVPLNLIVIEKLCEKAGVLKRNIKTFQRAREALAYLSEGGARDFPRTVVFTDMWMPEMTGEAFVTALRADDAFGHLPVVAVTADAETSGSYDMSLFDEIITKPITGSKVKSALARLSVPGGPRGGRRNIRYLHESTPVRKDSSR